MSVSMLLESPTAALATKFPPGQLLDRLNHHFVPRRVRYITHVLCAAELVIVEDLKDACILAQIKRMDERRLMRFDRYVPLDAAQKRAFIAGQMEWLKREHYLLGCRLGRCPSQSELSADFTANRNGQRFRAYYVLKYPQRMKREAIRPAIPRLATQTPPA